MAASFLDPRGILEISAKYFQTSSGVNPAMASDIISSFGKKVGM
jgi:hypothetical protein